MAGALTYSPGKPSTWDVVYLVNGVCKEILEYNKTKKLANGLKQKYATTHKLGRIEVVPNGTYK
jgi:hypothetical protein